ncbi:MAG: hypothetical protein RLZ62_2351 [Bacteroidota bacterium]|jgi:hypothetical protein
MKNLLLLLLLTGILPFTVSAQQRDTVPPVSTDEEDYSEYDNLGFADQAAKRYCNPKIFDLSPNRFISIGWDWQNGYTGNFSAIGEYADGETPSAAESADFSSTNGFRFSANIPVISKNSLVWQMGANFWNMNYTGSVTSENPDAAPLASRLLTRGLVTSGINTTVFKPLGEKQFLLIQGSADLSGDYSFTEFQSLRYLRYSGALIWGKRPHDRLQWGIGAARTYRVGEMNYIPVILYNWTAPNRKWGTEILFPARAHVRRTFNARSLLLAGYELEGQSYRISSLSDDQSLEIRRGEMRARLEYQRQLRGFVWVAFQVGYRHNWSFNSDYLPNDGQEFFRGFFGDQRYAMINTLTNALYFNLSFNLVSP